MKSRDIFELLLLAAIWGGSFLFMRIAVAEFGPVALASARVIGAAALMSIALAWRLRSSPPTRSEPVVAWYHWLVAGLTTTALPFLCFCYAAQFLKAGVLAIFNAATPLFGALVASAWLKERYTRLRVLGLALGFAGVVWLASAHLGSIAPAQPRPAWASASPVLACMSAAMLYGFSTNYAKKYLGDVAPMRMATYTLAIAAVFLLIPAYLAWPQHRPSLRAWSCAAALAALCTASAYLLFFRLLSRTGPTTTMSVTFLIPAFAVTWGLIFLGEPIEPQQILSAGLILTGTGLSTGLIRWRR